MHVYSSVFHVDDASFAQRTVVEDGKTEDLSDGEKEMWLWFSTVFPPSSGHMAFLPRNFNLVLCLFSLSLFLPPCPFPPIPISPTLLYPCQAAGITQMALAQARMLIWEKDAWVCREETLFVFLFALSHSIIAHWNLFFKLWKLPVSANCGSVYRFLSQCWMLCAHSQTQSLLLTLWRFLCCIWQWACCSVD